MEPVPFLGEGYKTCCLASLRDNMKPERRRHLSTRCMPSIPRSLGYGCVSPVSHPEKCGSRTQAEARDCRHGFTQLAACRLPHAACSMPNAA